jgi:hypothetical protein
LLVVFSSAASIRLSSSLIVSIFSICSCCPVTNLIAYAMAQDLGQQTKEKIGGLIGQLTGGYQKQVINREES